MHRSFEDLRTLAERTAIAVRHAPSDAIAIIMVLDILVTERQRCTQEILDQLETKLLHQEHH